MTPLRFRPLPNAFAGEGLGWEACRTNRLAPNRLRRESQICQSHGKVANWVDFADRAEFTTAPRPDLATGYRRLSCEVLFPAASTASQTN